MPDRGADLCAVIPRSARLEDAHMHVRRAARGASRAVQLWGFKGGARVDPCRASSQRRW